MSVAKLPSETQGHSPSRLICVSAERLANSWPRDPDRIVAGRASSLGAFPCYEQPYARQANQCEDKLFLDRFAARFVTFAPSRVARHFAEVVVDRPRVSDGTILLSDDARVGAFPFGVIAGGQAGRHQTMVQFAAAVWTHTHSARNSGPPSIRHIAHTARRNSRNRRIRCHPRFSEHD